MVEPNVSPSTPTTRTGRTAGKTSPIGRCHNSGRITETILSVSGTSFITSYALLHHPEYRERYAANLRRDLPRLPYTPDFWGFSKAGARLGEIHVGYEDVDEYPLTYD